MEFDESSAAEGLFSAGADCAKAIPMSAMDKQVTSAALHIIDVSRFMTAPTASAGGLAKHRWNVDHDLGEHSKFHGGVQCPLYPQKRTLEPARASPSTHQLPQLGDVRRDPPRHARSLPLRIADSISPAVRTCTNVR
jgi:hypothetical protein